MQVVNFGSENYMDLADALSMLIPEIMNNKLGYRPFPDFSYLKKKEKGEKDVGDGFRPGSYSDFFGPNRSRF